MSTVIRISKHLVPVEQIALFEPFVPPTETPLQSTRDFKARVVLLDRNSILSEETPEKLAADFGFRLLATDCVAANPTVHFRVETFTPAENFQPSKPYLSRLAWTDRDGNTQSKLLLASPENVLAVVVRGEADPYTEQEEPPIAQQATRSRRSPRARRKAFVAKELS